MAWAVARTKFNDAIAIQNLERQKFEVFNPTIVRRVVDRSGRVVMRPEQIFPTYIFVYLQPEQRWSPINSTFGVLHLLVRRHADGYDHPRWIPDMFIDQLRNGCDDHKDTPTRRWRLRPGMTVRITTGPLQGLGGLVESMTSDDRVRLLVHIMNRAVPVTVRVDEVVEVTADEDA
jgi:transcription antitermination factor NusG